MITSNVSVNVRDCVNNVYFKITNDNNDYDNMISFLQNHAR